MMAIYLLHLLIINLLSFVFCFQNRPKRIKYGQYFKKGANSNSGQFAEVKAQAQCIIVIIIEIRMNQVLEKGKELFIGKYYKEAIRFLNQSQAKVEDNQLDLLYQLRGCCYFLEGNYKLAEEQMQRAIDLNKAIPQYLINMSAIYRKLNKAAISQQYLRMAEEVIRDPAIYYNRKLLNASNSDEELKINLTCLISKYQNNNSDYDFYEGLSPSFMKSMQSRVDFIFRQENSLVKLLERDIADENLGKILPEIIIQFNRRIKSYQAEGVLFCSKLKIQHQGLHLLFQTYQAAHSQIKFEEGRRNFMEKFVPVFHRIRKDSALTNEQIEKQVLPLEKVLDLEKEKNIVPFQNPDDFNENRNIPTDVIFSVDWEVSRGVRNKIPIEMTSQLICFLIDPHLMRSFKPTKTEQALDHCLQTYKMPYAVGEYLYHLYWMIQLRIVFNSKQGFDIPLFLQMKAIISHIYSEMNSKYKLADDPQQYFYKKLSSINKCSDSFSSFVPPDKCENIQKNCERLKEEIGEVDEWYSLVIRNSENFEFLINLETIKEGQVFRKRFGLGKNFNDLLVENALVFFYHLRDVCPVHHLIKHGFNEMIYESESEDNGKNSFFKNYCEKNKEAHFCSRLSSALRKVRSLFQ